MRVRVRIRATVNVRIRLRIRFKITVSVGLGLRRNTLIHSNCCQDKSGLNLTANPNSNPTLALALRHGFLSLLPRPLHLTRRRDAGLFSRARVRVRVQGTFTTLWVSIRKRVVGKLRLTAFLVLLQQCRAEAALLLEGSAD